MEKQIVERAKKIIKTKQITDQIPIDNIAFSIADVLKSEFPNYQIEVFDASRDVDCFYIQKKSTKKTSTKDSLLDNLFRLKPTEPMTKEAQKIAEIGKQTLESILQIIDVVHPGKYPTIIKEMGLTELKHPPALQLQTIDLWAEKIIKYFKITQNMGLLKIAKRINVFFDVIFPEYSISYFVPSDKEKFPVSIRRTSGNDFMWLNEIDKIRNSIYLTYLSILNKLDRKKDYPKDPEFWFILVLAYEEMGLPVKANEMGDYGLSLNPQKLNGLTEIVTYYAEKKQPTKALKYMKKVGALYLHQNQFSIALKIWQNIVQFEPNVKNNLLTLATVYRKIGDIKSAEKFEAKAKTLK